MFENKFSLQNKKVLITGASSGIGKATAILVSNLGAGLIICGRNEERLSNTFSELNYNQLNTQFIGDLENEVELDNLVSKIDKIDGIVLSAGVMFRKPFKFLTNSNINNVMKINFFSPIMLCQKLIKEKKLNKNGSIVFISSIAGNTVGDKGIGAYAASKGSLNAICKVLALEIAPQKIRANCINPGMVWTPMNLEAADITESELKENEKSYPLGYGSPEDVAYCASFLLSDASKWITGSSIVIDGGFSIQ